MFLAVVAIINIVLNWIFINKYGYNLGYTAVFCYTLFAIGHYLLYKYLNRKYLYSISIVREIFIVLSCVIVCANVLDLILYNNYVHLRYIVIVVIAITIL